MKINDDCNNCLTDCVGVRNCCLPQEVCSSFIDDLPGISNELAFGVMDLAKDKTFLDFYERTKRNSYTIFKNDLLNELGKYSTFKGVLRKSTRSNPIQPLEPIVSDAEHFGYLVSLYDNLHQSLNLKTISFYSGTQIPELTIYFRDLTTGIEHEKTFTNINIGYNNIPIDLSFSTEFNQENLLIYFNQEGLTLYEMDCGGRNMVKCSPCLCNKDIDRAVGSIEFDEVDDVLLDVYSNSSAFCISGEVSCNIDNLICDYKDHFCEAFKYLWAIEILKEKLASYNLNFFTQSNLSVIEQGLIPDFKKEYYKNLNRTVKNIISSVQHESICFDCMPEHGGSYFTSR